MKSVDNEWQRVCRFLIGAACTSVVVFVACSGSSEHRAAPRYSAAGDGSGGGAAGATELQGGRDSAQAGEASGGQPVLGGGAGGVGAAGEAAGGAASAGGAAGGVGGVGGDPGVGGEGAAAGQSLGGAAGEAAGGGGAGGEAPFVDPVCGVNMVKVGEYSLWCGKVNEHTDVNGEWQPDADCTSGCNVAGVGYCQKFYPTATAIVAAGQVGIKDWKNAGFISGQSGACNDSTPDAPGIDGQAACCAPL